jgi:photosystem II stability/assembly factor-like uncharacterized protein
MKKLIFLSFFIFISSYSLKGQWKLLSSGTDKWLTSIYFLNDSVGYVVGYDGAILKTKNGGESWEEKNSGITTRLLSVFFISEQIGWAVGDFGIILKTTDAGESWLRKGNYVYPALNSVFFINNNKGWIAGGDYTFDRRIFITQDGGENWTYLYGVADELFSIFFVDPLLGWSTGLNGAILKSTDGGFSWSDQTSGTYEQIFSCFFIDANLGWCSGFNGIILKTTNGGNLWEIKNQGGYHLHSICFVNSQIGWAVGGYAPLTGNIILKTTDGGEKWSSQTNPAEYRLESVHFIDDTVGWIAGGYGNILKTTNGGVMSVERIENSDITDDYVLFQNYPNPFNPTTEIIFSIPNESKIIIKVYDMIGNEIITLVNESLMPGKYKTHFDGSNLSSGTYLIYMQGENFSKTIKTLLLK